MLSDKMVKPTVWGGVGINDADYVVQKFETIELCEW